MNAALWLIGIVGGVVACAYAAALWGWPAGGIVGGIVGLLLLVAHWMARRAPSRR